MDVVAHVAVSVDGSTVGFEPDVARFYDLATTWNEEVTLVGADTILAQEAALAGASGRGPDPDGPLLAVVDSQHRVSCWTELRDAGHWSDVVALRTSLAGTPAREIVTGGERVDLGAALEQLGAERIRVDSGGTLIRVMLAEGLLTEISLLVHPVLQGGTHRWYGPEPPAVDLEPLAAEYLGGGLTWLRYAVPH